jgi:hypothetical protein
MADEVVKVESPRVKLVDPNTGIQVVKGSISKDATFVQALLASYTNLTHNPAALIVGAILLFTYLSIEAGTPTPFRQIHDKLHLIINDTDATRWEVALAKALVVLFDFILKYENQIVVIGFAWVPVLVKPSTNSIILATVHSFIVFILRDWHSFTFMLLANAHLIYVSMRNPLHKLIVIIITIGVFFAGVEIGGKPIFSPGVKPRVSTTTKAPVKA